MSVHINASGVNAGAQEGDIDIATMKKFVSYCRLKCAPRLSEAAATMLSSQVCVPCSQTVQTRTTIIWCSERKIIRIPSRLVSFVCMYSREALSN